MYFLEYTNTKNNAPLRRIIYYDTNTILLEINLIKNAIKKSSLRKFYS